MHEDKSYTLA